MADVSIRGVDEDVWAEFKSKAAMNKLTISEYLETLLKKERTSNSKEILHGKKVLDEKSAKAILESSKEIRKNFRMRDVDWG